MSRRDTPGRSRLPGRAWAIRGAAVVALLGLAALTGPSATASASPAPPPGPPDYCHHLVWPQAGQGGGHCPGPPSSPVHLETTPPNGPFVSGELVTVSVDPNPVLQPGGHVYIEECAAPAGLPTHWQSQCDPRTIQRVGVRVGRHGTIRGIRYPVFALPDSTVLGEPASGTPVCNLTHPCVLLVSEYRCSLVGQHVWSLPFSVGAAGGGGGGGDPGNGLPEVPYVVILPVLAVAIFAIALGVRRRRVPTT